MTNYDLIYASHKNILDFYQKIDIDKRKSKVRLSEIILCHCTFLLLSH